MGLLLTARVPFLPYLGPVSFVSSSARWLKGCLNCTPEAATVAAIVEPYSPSLPELSLSLIISLILASLSLLLSLLYDDLKIDRRTEIGRETNQQNSIRRERVLASAAATTTTTTTSTAYTSNNSGSDGRRSTKHVEKRMSGAHFFKTSDVRI